MSLLAYSAVGTQAGVPVARVPVAYPVRLAGFVVGDQSYLLNATQSATEGTPSAPSQSHPSFGVLRGIKWRVTAGARTFAISAKYTGAAPRLHFLASPGVGMASTVIVTGGAATGDWQTLQYSFTARDTGVIEVWRERQEPDPAYVLYWDNIVVT